MRKNEQLVSILGVVTLALVLPAILRMANNITKFLVGAEGRLAAITIETDHPLGPLPEPWRGISQGGDQLLTFMDEAKDDLIMMRPEYIRIDHIYDQFGVVNYRDGEIYLDWSKLDKTVDQMLDIGAKPFFCLSYMPSEMGTGDLVSEPKDWNKWSWLVQQTVERYSGIKGIEGVYYEVWNEPDLFGKWSMGGKKDYKNLYFYSVRGASLAKNVMPFKIGGPATTGLYKNWMDQFFVFVQQNKLRLDFFSWHRYDLSLSKYAEDVTNVDKWIEGHPYFSQVEKIVTEMGPNSEMGRENDNNVGAAHVVAAARELMFKVKYGFNFSVWGNWGVIGKPRGEAIKMLSRMKGQRLALTGEGTWVRAIGTQDADDYKILLVNYDPKGIHSEVVPVTFVNLHNREFVVLTEVLGGVIISKEVATNEAILQYTVPMAPNSVTMLTLSPKSVDLED